MPIFFRQILLLSLLTLPSISFSNEEELAYFEDSHSKEASTSPSINRVASTRDWFGNKVDNINTAVDSFFVQKVFGKDIFNGDLPAKNKSKVFFETGPVERRGVETNIGIDVRLTLPNSKEQLKFVVSSSNSETEKKDHLTELERERDSLFTGFQYISKSIKNWQPTLKLGAKWGSSPEIFLEGRLSRRFGTPQHNLFASHSASYFSKRRLINTTKLDYFKSLNHDWGFAIFNQARHFEQGNYYEFKFAPNLQQRLSDRNAIFYQIAAAGDDKAHPYTDSYTASIRWRRRIHSTWLYFDITPSHTYFVAPLINNNPKSEAAIFFRLEVLINND